MAWNEEGRLGRVVEPNLLCIESAFRPVSSSANPGSRLWLRNYVQLAHSGCYSPSDESNIAKLEGFVQNFFTQELHLEGLSWLSSFNPRARQATPPSTTSRRSKKIIFTDFQSEALEENFKFKKYLSPSSRKWLANLLGLSKQQVVTWFQNRRAKERKRAGVKLPRHGRKFTLVGNCVTPGIGRHKNLEDAVLKNLPTLPKRAITVVSI